MRLALVLALSSSSLLSRAAFSQRTVAPRGPIIDVHVHAYPDDDPRFANRTPNPATGQPLQVRNAEEHRRATLDLFRRYNIVQAVVSNGTGPVEIVGEWLDAAPDRVMPGAGFDGPTLDTAWIRAQYRAGRLRVLGEIGAQYAGLSLADPRFEPILALAEELDLPVGVHTGIGFPGAPYNSCCRGFRTTLGNPVQLEEVLVRHPTLRLYLMHAGWPYLQETVAIMSVYPQVYADLAVVDWIIPREEFHAYLQALERAGLGKRLMFGSDQMVWPEAIGLAIEGIESATFLTAEQRRDIFFNNAARFLRMDITRTERRQTPR